MSRLSATVLLVASCYVAYGFYDLGVTFKTMFALFCLIAWLAFDIYQYHQSKNTIRFEIIIKDGLFKYKDDKVVREFRSMDELLEYLGETNDSIDK